MDRRKLIVGGGAAALGAMLVSVSGRGTPAAASAAPVSTAAHAQSVLDLVDVDLGLVNPAGLRSQFQESYATCQATFAKPDVEISVLDDLDAWIRERTFDLCGTDSYEVAVTEAPAARTLVAFSFLAYSQNQDVAIPQIESGMPVPAMLKNLEPDFLPVLVGQINDKSNASPAFAGALQASLDEVDQMIAQNQQDPGDGAPLQGSPNGPGDTIHYVVGVIGFISFLYWIKSLGQRK
jgi:hypothetical protein